MAAKKRIVKRDINFTFLGGPVMVYDRLNEEYGDCQVIATINRSNRVPEYRVVLSDEQKQVIADYAATISQSQEQLVFATRPMEQVA